MVTVSETRPCWAADARRVVNMGHKDTPARRCPANAGGGTLPRRVISGRRLLLALSCIVAAVGIVIWIQPTSRHLALIIVLCGLISLLVLNAFRPAPPREPEAETDDIDKLGEERRRELVRGTSMHLRNMSYRYSVRFDATMAGERHCFSAEVNTVRLGFVPVFITDNTNDRQGYGYVAFVHDGKRWCGPGLPCPGEQTAAVRHAARCVSPLATEEETQF